MKKTIYKLNGIDIIMINTNKFKNTYFNIIFSGKYDEKNICKRNLLIDMIINSCKKYNSNKLLNNRLNELYSTNISSNYTKQYELSQTSFFVNCVNEKYIKENNFYQKVVEIIYEIIYNPRIENNLFNEDVFNECKDNLENKIRSLYDSKSSYSIIKLLENMAPEEVISKSSLGTLNELETLTLKDISDEYQRLLSENLSIYIVGEFDENKILNYFGNYFTDAKDIKGTNLCPLNFVENKKFIIEKQEITQSKLLIGFRINEEFNLKNYLISLIFNYIFGGSYSSVLTTKIRKDNSFAYSIYSNMVLQYKLMYINMGIDKVNYKKILRLVEEELLKLKDGFIAEELIHNAKKMMISEVRNMQDSLGAIMGSAIFYYLYGFSIEDKTNINVIESININDLEEFANKIVFDTVFLLEAI